MHALLQLHQLTLALLDVMPVLRVAVRDARLQPLDLLLLVFELRRERFVLVAQLALALLLLRQLALVLLERQLQLLLALLQVLDVGTRPVLPASRACVNTSAETCTSQRQVKFN